MRSFFYKAGTLEDKLYSYLSANPNEAICYLVAAQAFGYYPSMASETLAKMWRQGALDRCGTIKSKGAPRHLYCVGDWTCDKDLSDRKKRCRYGDEKNQTQLLLAKKIRHDLVEVIVKPIAAVDVSSPISQLLRMAGV